MHKICVHPSTRVLFINNDLRGKENLFSNCRLLFMLHSPCRHMFVSPLNLLEHDLVLKSFIRDIG